LVPHLVFSITMLVVYILQTAIFSQISLIAGTPDLILLFLAAWSLQEKAKYAWIWIVVTGFLVSIISAMPFYAPLIAYLGVFGISKLLQRQVWRIPLLAMFIVSFLGSLFQGLIYVIILKISGSMITWGQSLDAVILPSILLNLIFTIPIYAIVSDISGRVFSAEENV